MDWSLVIQNSDRMSLLRTLPDFISIQSCLTLAVVSSLSLLSGSVPARADERNHEGEVRVYVRTIEATNPKLQDGNGSEPASSPLDPELSDLKLQLKQLPFSSYRLICKRQQLLSVLEKDTMKLPRSQSLAFRPIYMEEKRIGLWLSWKDASGGDILNTRIHFDTDDAVLTGTDSAHDSGLILAIKAEAAEQPSAAAPAAIPSVEQPGS
jgi:hypothetical protein